MPRNARRRDAGGRGGTRAKQAEQASRPPWAGNCTRKSRSICRARRDSGRLDDYVTRSGYVITPVVVWGGCADGLVANPDEVQSIHRLPTSSSVDPKARIHDDPRASDRSSAAHLGQHDDPCRPRHFSISSRKRWLAASRASQRWSSPPRLGAET